MPNWSVRHPWNIPSVANRNGRPNSITAKLSHPAFKFKENCDVINISSNLSFPFDMYVWLEPSDMYDHKKIRILFHGIFNTHSKHGTYCFDDSLGCTRFSGFLLYYMTTYWHEIAFHKSDTFWRESTGQQCATITKGHQCQALMALALFFLLFLLLLLACRNCCCKQSSFWWFGTPCNADLTAL